MQEQILTPESKPIPLPKAQKQAEHKMLSKPEMSASAVAYPKLHKIYKELVRQNKTIIEAEKERNTLEEKQGSLKGLLKLIKKGELQSEIDWIKPLKVDCPALQGDMVIRRCRTSTEPIMPPRMFM